MSYMLVMALIGSDGPAMVKGDTYSSVERCEAAGKAYVEAMSRPIANNRAHVGRQWSLPHYACVPS